MIRLLQKYTDAFYCSPYRTRYLGILILICLIAGLPALQMKVDNRLSDWFPDDAHELQVRQNFIEAFGSDEWIFLYLRFPGDTGEQRRIEIKDSVTGELERIEEINGAFSRREITRFKRGLPQYERDYADELERRLFGEQNPGGEFIIMQVDVDDHRDVVEPSVVDSVQGRLSVLPDGVDHHLTGSSVIYSELDRLSSREAGLLLSIAFLVITIALRIRTGDRHSTLKMMGLALLALWPALAWFGLLDHPVNMVTMVVPVLLMVLLVTFVLHLSDRHTELQNHLRIKITPVMLAAVTTAIGFGSLIFSEFQIIRSFGLLTSLGLLTGLVVILLIGLPTITSGRHFEVNQQSLFSRMLQGWYQNLTRIKAAFVCVFALGIIIAGVLMFPRIPVDTNTIRFLSEGNPVREDVRLIENDFGWFNPVDIMVKRSDEEPLQKEDWESIAVINERLTGLEFTEGVISYDMMLPLELELAGVVSDLYLNEDGSATRLMMRIPMESAGQMQEYLDVIMAETNRVAANNGLEAEPAGYLPIYLYQMNHIVSGMLENLAIALALIIGIIMVAMRSVKPGLLALFPNLFPLLLIALIMAVAGIPLDISTSVIACVVIGIVVDDSIHVLWYYKRYGAIPGKRFSEFSGSLVRLLRPITTSTIIFTLGFLVLTFSNVGSIVNMGLLGALGMLAAWTADLVLFPALIKLANG